MKKLYFLAATLVAIFGKTQQFEEIPTVFKDYYYSAAAIGDYNNDGFQDVFFTGAINENGYATYNEFYKNTNGIFSVQQIFTDNAVHFNNGNVKFIDFDNDGLLDIVTTGLNYNDVVNYQQYRYKNNGVTFDQIENNAGKIYGGIEVFDFNHNGKQDYAINGVSLKGGDFLYDLDLYLNNGENFEKINKWLPGSQSGDFKVADFNNDTFLDVMIYGYDADFSPFFRYYNNDGKGNLLLSQEFISIGGGKMAYADFNADGYLDVVVSGMDQNHRSVMRVLMNDGKGKFTEDEITEGIVSNSFIDTGDLNGDGYYDFIIIGDDDDYDGFVNVFLYNPDSNTFTLHKNTGLYNLGSGGTIHLFDYNNDRLLDVVMSGFDWTMSNYPALTKLYRNISTQTNAKPTAPQMLSADVQADKILFNWENSSDDKTPENALQYELSVGSQSGKSDIAKYVITTKNWYLNKENLPEKIFWSVKSIDASKVYSDSSQEQTLDVLAVADPLAVNVALYPNPVKDKLNFKTNEKIQSVKVINITGQTVKFQNGNIGTISLNSLPEGVYIVELRLEDGKTVTKKILKK